MAETKNMITDLVALQKALPVLPKDTTNPFFKSKYTSLDTITEVVFPIMTKHNFAWTTRPSFNEAGQPTLKYSLMHISGETIEGEMLLQLAKADPQGQGSAITYSRRYAITSVLGIVSDADDDGSAAQKAAQFAKSTTSEYKSPEEPSRQLKDEPILDLSKEVLKQAIQKSGRFKSKTDVTAFYYDVLQKDGPTTEADVDKLIKALEEPF
jgi:hypothetical protein